MTDMNHMNDKERKGIASSVLSRIESEGVTPTPRSRFVLQEGAVWGAGALSIFVGALGVASIIFTARNSEWEFYEATHDTLLTFAVEIAPYAWLIALIVFTAIAYEAVRHTKRGYRYPVPMLTLAVAGVSVVGGGLVFAMGGGHFADELAEYVPAFRSLEQRKLVVWDKPERGLIAGIVTEVAENGESFTLRSPSNSLHTVYMDVLDQDMRDEIVVGSFMRVMAPLIERPQFAYDEAHDTAEDTSATMAIQASDEDGSSAATSMMMTSVVTDDASDVSIEMESTVAVDGEATTMMMKSAAPTANSRAMKEGEKPKLLREACAILPMREESREEWREAVQECLHELKEARENRDDNDEEDDSDEGDDNEDDDENDND